MFGLTYRYSVMFPYWGEKEVHKHRIVGLTANLFLHGICDCSQEVLSKSIDAGENLVLDGKGLDDLFAVTLKKDRLHFEANEEVYRAFCKKLQCEKFEIKLEFYGLQYEVGYIGTYYDWLDPKSGKFIQNVPVVESRRMTYATTSLSGKAVTRFLETEYENIGHIPTNEAEKGRIP